MTCDAVSGGQTERQLSDALLRVAMDLDVVASARVSAASDVSADWRGATRDRFDQERGRQSAIARHLNLQARRLAFELSAK